MSWSARRCEGCTLGGCGVVWWQYVASFYKELVLRHRACHTWKRECSGCVVGFEVCRTLSEGVLPCTDGTRGMFPLGCRTGA